ncbi:aspartyl/asparaginyl beta-hydroxylase domain-containing protein [Amycolatopsis rubida]|uniref:Aspartate beta-hydroxylase n=1 Tax=Amycolatopsis rubida TaxID=112413 RepID=A0A1I6AJ84_9PSEU|nr:MULTISPECIES: aspartyl/asparaginyl beta-hydroxylase domain-containing protein [Amycolatopsis]MYW94284.1 aspartyl/asparaginyl beta-hydroxylase domain-containing protein [Amycolatopsis rubida]NEC59273.1 aspartyl/asparaginyl beta-hydroxylase domain-containing protein [Amycolatopsis rubida]OAP23149.1 Aspartyl/Asparaginyl beta-hydroxylase [Amycolatopsis sp. M39]SFQ68732.1 aspartate beta-hydroxylase [Amycolatopsis rubida]
MTENQGAGTSGTVGARAYLEQMVRRYYASLIDAWHYAGDPEKAMECAAAAVRQGVWDQPFQRAREHIPGLRARPVHDAGEFWFTAYLEENYPLIRAEIEQVLDTPLDPVVPTTDDAGLIRKGAWKQAHLYRDGRWQTRICSRFPVTTGILDKVPDVTALSPGVITVSRVSPGTHIMPHCGPTNALLRIHLPITVPPGVSIRVADREMRWQEGKCLVFDDSFEHEVHHRGTEDRVVLILDVLHPDLAGDHQERLLRRQRNFEEQIVAFMRERGLARVRVRDGEIALTPDDTVRQLVATYLSGTGITGAELDGDQVRWERADASAGAPR